MRCHLFDLCVCVCVCVLSLSFSLLSLSLRVKYHLREFFCLTTHTISLPSHSSIQKHISSHLSLPPMHNSTVQYTRTEKKNKQKQLRKRSVESKSSCHHHYSFPRISTFSRSFSFPLFTLSQSERRTTPRAATASESFACLADRSAARARWA